MQNLTNEKMTFKIISYGIIIVNFLGGFTFIGFFCYIQQKVLKFVETGLKINKNGIDKMK